MSIYLLIHGSFQGGWIWKPTAKVLKDMGHTVYAPTLDGCGERAQQIRPGITVTSQAMEIYGLLFNEDLEDVILVGTSTGGLVASKIAELSRERISRIVYVDALAPQPGELVSNIVVRDSDQINEITDLSRGPSREDAAKRLFAELEPSLREWALQRYTLHPIEASEAPDQLDLFWSQEWPDTRVIRCNLSVNPPESHQRRTAERLKASWHELDAGHYPMLSHPKELAQLLI